jgi:hypothetical protein
VTASLAAILALAFGCSSDRSSVQLRGSTTTPACAVVTAADAAGVLHTPVAASSDLPAWDCSYLATRFQPSEQTQFSSALVSLQTGSSKYLVRFFSNLRTGHVVVRPSGIATPPARVVSAVGDEALWDGQFLYVRSGIWLLDVSVRINNTPSLAKSIDLARLGLARLAKPVTP